MHNIGCVSNLSGFLEDLDMSGLALFLLGPPRVEFDGERVQIGRRKAVALLAYFAVTGSSQSRDTLATLLWPDYDHRGARGRLRRTLSTLNRTLGGAWLTADRETISLSPDPNLWLDVDQFRQRLAACEAHGHPADKACPDCLTRLTEAVALYRDDFMAGFTLPDSLAFDEWQRYQTEGLQDELASVLEQSVGCHSVQGEVDPAIAYARRWLELDPLHEPAHRRLIELYAQAGRRAADQQRCIRQVDVNLPIGAQAVRGRRGQHLANAGQVDGVAPV